MQAHNRERIHGSRILAKPTVTLDTAKPKVLDVSAAPESFKPGSGQSTTLRFTLSDNLSGTCTAQVKILNVSGAQVNTLSSSAACPSTGAAISVVWNGRNSGGAIVSKGSYTYQVQGTDQALNLSAVQQWECAGEVGVIPVQSSSDPWSAQASLRTP